MIPGYPELLTKKSNLFSKNIPHVVAGISMFAFTFIGTTLVFNQNPLLVEAGIQSVNGASLVGAQTADAGRGIINISPITGTRSIVPMILPELPDFSNTTDVLYEVAHVKKEEAPEFSRNSCPSSFHTTKDNFFLQPINKQQSLGDYIPTDLVEVQNVIDTKYDRIVCLDRTVAVHLKNMANDAKAAGHSIILTSGYRSPQIQKELYIRAISKSGYIGTKLVAPPFYSQHNYGLAIDITSPTVQQASASISFNNTPEGKWVAENGHRYGFILSYPKGKEILTGYMYEPWHWRFVGTENAKVVRASGKTFHEIVTSDKTTVVRAASILAAKGQDLKINSENQIGG